MMIYSDKNNQHYLLVPFKMLERKIIAYYIIDSGRLIGLLKDYGTKNGFYIDLIDNTVLELYPAFKLLFFDFS